MKIHPLFKKAIWYPHASFLGEMNPIDQWELAGCPVVEEELPTSPYYSELATANARIKELEDAYNDLQTSKNVGIGDLENVEYTAYVKGWNEAIEAAATSFDPKPMSDGRIGTTGLCSLASIAAQIRELKR